MNTNRTKKVVSTAGLATICISGARAVALAAAAAMAAISAGSFVPATAAPGEPVGQCPPVYTMTEAMFPAQMALDTGNGGNGDGWICRKAFEHGPNVGVGNIIDNDVPLHVTIP